MRVDRIVPLRGIRAHSVVLLEHFKRRNILTARADMLFPTVTALV